MKSNRKNKQPPKESGGGISSSLRDILYAEFIFHPGLRISKDSLYSDPVWSWIDLSNLRLNIYDNHRLSIDWPQLLKQYSLTPRIVESLKRYAFLRLHYSREAFPENNKAGNAHPATVVNEIRAVVLFLSHLRAQLSGDGYSLISDLSHIEAEDLNNALSTYPGRQRPCIKKVLTSMGSPLFGRLLDGGPLKWNSQDILCLRWSAERREPYERLGDGVFHFLSDAATKDVKLFLRALGVEPADRTQIGGGANLYLEEFDKFHALFEEYVTEITSYRKSRQGDADEARRGATRYAMWLQAGKGEARRLKGLVDRARTAAQLILAMYTGCRLSELLSFKRDCLRREDNDWVIAGTLVKRQALTAPSSSDKWVAIPIVRDAVKVLEQSSRLAGSEYLFHGQRKIVVRDTARVGGGLVTEWFEKYLSKVDVDGKWKGTKLHVHKFRHTLVFQMRRAGLNLPFITFQLKHSYDAMNRRVAEATLLYGNIGNDATAKAIYEANFEVVRQVYHPDAPVAGAGSEQLKARRAAFFAGMAIQGSQVDDVLRQLARQRLPLTDVGMALCQGQRKIVIDGVKADPPCVGQLRCNPLRCPNAIIPEYKKHLWRRVASESKRRARDPELSHAKSYHEEAACEADMVVSLLETDKRGTDGR